MRFFSVSRSVRSSIRRNPDFVANGPARSCGKKLEILIILQPCRVSGSPAAPILYYKIEKVVKTYFVVFNDEKLILSAEILFLQERTKIRQKKYYKDR